MNKALMGSLAAITLLFSQVNAEQYTVTFKGMEAGKADLSITQTAANYQAKLALYPVMLAKLSGIDDMVESASGDIREGHFYPNNYRRTDKNGSTLLNVNFTGQSARVVEGNEERTLKIAAMGQDPLSQIAQIQYDLRNGRLQEAYYLVTKNNQRKYSVTQNEQQVILTEQPSKHRQLVLQFDNNYVLTRMQKNKGGKTQFSMQKK